MRFRFSTSLHKTRSRIANITTAAVLAGTGFGGGLPLLIAEQAHALPSAYTVCASGCDYTDVQSAINAASAGDTIQLNGDQSISSQITIAKPLTLDGNGYTISPTFTYTGNNANNSSVGIDGTHDVTLTNLTIDGTAGTDLHGVNIYESTNVNLSNVTSENNDKDGVVVNGSTVSVTNLSTSGNSWGGIDVDQGTGVTDPAQLTVHAASYQTEIAAIVIDDTTKNVSVTDADSQYTYFNPIGNLRIYTQIPTGVANQSPADGTYTTTAGLTTITWHAATSPHGPLTYYYESSNSNSTKLDGSLTSPAYGPVSTGANTYIPTGGTPAGVWYWHVRAKDSLGNYSDWTNPWKITVDNTAPTTPTGGLPNNSTEFTNDFWFTWNPSTDTSPVTYQFQSSMNPASSGGVLTTGVWHSGTLSSPTIHSTGAPDGVWYWQVRAIDAAGNTSPWSAIWQVRLDNATLPAPTLIAPTDGAYVNGASLTNSWSAVTGAAKYEYQSFNDPAGLHLRFDSTYTTTSKTATNVPDGTVFYWRVRAFDQYGKPGSWSNGGDLWKVTVDNTAPVVPIAVLSDANDKNIPDNGYINTLHFRFNLSDSSSDVTHYQLKYWNDIPASPFKQNSPWNPTNLSGYSTSPAQLGAYLDQFTQGEGTHYFEFSACDAANNCSAYSAPFTVTYDATAPVITDNFNVNMLTGDKVTLKPTVTDKSPVTYQWKVSDSKLLSNPNDMLDGTSLAIGPAPKGTYTVTLVVTDAAGNATTATYNVTINTPAENNEQHNTAPTQPQVLGANSSNNNSNNNGEVLGDSTTTPAAPTTPTNTNANQPSGNGTVTVANAANKSNTLLGLGWWWLAIIGAAVLGFLLFLFGRSANNDKPKA